VGLIVRSFSRGGFLALSVVLVFIFLMTKKRIIFLFIAIVGIMAVMSYAPEKFFSEIKTIEEGTEEGTASKRVEYWRRAVEMFKENPLMGKGIGQFPILSHRYVKPSVPIDETDFLVCHSNWFQIISELGLVGILLYFTIFYKYFNTWRMISNYKNTGAMDQKLYDFYLMATTGLMIGMTGFMVAGSFINFLHFPYFYTYAFMMMGIKNTWIIEQERIRKAEKNIEKGQNNE
jgi:O-antigen ligase